MKCRGVKNQMDVSISWNFAATIGERTYNCWKEISFMQMKKRITWKFGRYSAHPTSVVTGYLPDHIRTRTCK
jgi:hypothetical protein